MKANRELQALPSKVLLQTGESPSLDTVPDQSRTKINQQIYLNIANELSNYFTSHSGEWNDFITAYSFIQNQNRKPICK